MIHLTKQNRILLSALSGVLMVVSFPFTGSITPLVFVSWIPLLLVESYISQKRYRSSKVYLHAFFSFLIYNAGTTWWIWYASEGGAIFAIVLNALIMALVFYFFHLFKKKYKGKIGYVFLFLFWISFEYIHYFWELSWPWLNVGNAFSITPEIVQWYSVTGVLGGTCWVLLVNLFGFFVVQNVFFKQQKWQSQFKSLVLVVGLIAIPIIFSVVLYGTYAEKSDPVEIVAIQPNIDPYNEKFTVDLKQQLDKIFFQADRKVTKETSIVIAPETAISSTFFEDDVKSQPFFAYILKRKKQWGNISFLTGASTVRFFNTKHSSVSRKLEGGPGFIESYNTSLLIDNENIPHFVHKSKLVLGVEKIPFLGWMPWLEQFVIDLDGASGSLGIENEPKVLKADHLNFAPSICYESVYGEFVSQQVKRGAQLIFVITNDGWWRDTPGYKQHASFSRLRAIENRRSVARSANTGISCFINQRGDVIQKTGWWEPTAIRGELNKNSTLTIYARLGDYLGKLAMFLLVILIVFEWVKSIQKLIRKY